MKRLLLLALYCCCTFYTGFAQEQPFTLNQGQSSVASYHEVLPVDIVGQKIVVAVMVNGKSRRFILDTGAPVILSAALAAELRPKVLKTILVKDAFGKQDSMNVVAVEKLVLGNTGFEQIPALIAPASDKLMECMHVDGIVGSNLLRQSIVQFDLQHKTVILSSDDARFSFEKKEGMKLSKTPAQSNPYIKLQLASKITLNVLFDSGDNDFLSISNRHYEFIRKENKKALKVLATGFGSNSYGLHGKELNTQKLRLQAEKVSVGNVAFTNVITETMDDPDSRVGMKLMEYGIVTLDYKNERFYFHAYNDLKTIALNEKKWQVQPNLEQGKIIVGIAWGPMAEKVKHGEEIVAVNGKPTIPVDICKLFREKILPADSTTVSLTIKGADGAERTIDVIKE